MSLPGVKVPIEKSLPKMLGRLRCCCCCCCLPPTVVSDFTRRMFPQEALCQSYQRSHRMLASTRLCPTRKSKSAHYVISHPVPTFSTRHQASLRSRHSPPQHRMDAVRVLLTVVHSTSSSTSTHSLPYTYNPTAFISTAFVYNAP